MKNKLIWIVLSLAVLSGCIEQKVYCLKQAGVGFWDYDKPPSPEFHRVKAYTFSREGRFVTFKDLWGVNTHSYARVIEVWECN